MLHAEGQDKGMKKSRKRSLLINKFDGEYGSQNRLKTLVGQTDWPQSLLFTISRQEKVSQHFPKYNWQLTSQWLHSLPVSTHFMHFGTVFRQDGALLVFPAALPTVVLFCWQSLRLTPKLLLLIVFPPPPPRIIAPLPVELAELFVILLGLVLLVLLLVILPMVIQVEVVLLPVVLVGIGSEAIVELSFWASLLMMMLVMPLSIVGLADVAEMLITLFAFPLLTMIVIVVVGASCGFTFPTLLFSIDLLGMVPFSPKALFIRLPMLELLEVLVLASSMGLFMLIHFLNSGFSRQFQEHFLHVLRLGLSYYKHPSSSPSFMIKLSLLFSSVIKGFSVLFYLCSLQDELVTPVLLPFDSGEGETLNERLPALINRLVGLIYIWESADGSFTAEPSKASSTSALAQLNSVLLPCSSGWVSFLFVFGVAYQGAEVDLQYPSAFISYPSSHMMHWVSISEQTKQLAILSSSFFYLRTQSSLLIQYPVKHLEHFPLVPTSLQFSSLCWAVLSRKG